MKVLLDEHVPHALRPLLIGHDAFTVGYLGWSGTRNGALLRRAAAGGFDVLLTLDASIEYQQNLATLPLAVLVVAAPPGDMAALRPVVPAILDGLRRVAPRTVVHVP